MSSGFDSLFVDGNYQIFVSDLGILDEHDELYLEDKFLHQKVLLTQNDIYEFSSNSIADPDRFNLYFVFRDKQPIAADNSKEVKIYSIEKEVFVHLLGPSDCQILIYDLMGRLVVEGTGYQNTLNKFKVNSKTGIYVVKAIDDKQVYSEKVFIE